MMTQFPDLYSVPHVYLNMKDVLSKTLCHISASSPAERLHHQLLVWGIIPKGKLYSLAAPKREEMVQYI